MEAIITANKVRADALALIEEVKALELSQMANLRLKQQLENSIQELSKADGECREALDIAVHAIEILQGVSDGAVQIAYKFLEDGLNVALARMFKHTTRRIRLREYMRSNQYPQLEIELIVGNKKKRSLRADSGHGLAQIVSLLSVLSIIVITGGRRILVMDEVIGGLSAHNREIVADLMWQFTKIGFQFVIVEHGFIPKGSKVYNMEMVGDVSGIKNSYIEQNGVYVAVNEDTNLDNEPLNVFSVGAEEATQSEKPQNTATESQQSEKPQDAIQEQTGVRPTVVSI